MVTIDETKFNLNIRDFGQKFDKSRYAPPDLDIATEGGYGVFLIEQMMDEVIYIDPTGPGTELNLVKYRAGR